MDSVSKIITTALKPFNLPVAENLYEGKKDEYFTFNYADDSAEDTGDDEAQAYVAYMQIHYICPMDKSYLQKKKLIRRALISAGFTPPSVQDVTDTADRLRHLVFECEIENEYEMED